MGGSPWPIGTSGEDLALTLTVSCGPASMSLSCLRAPSLSGNHSKDRKGQNALRAHPPPVHKEISPRAACAELPRTRVAGRRPELRPAVLSHTPGVHSYTPFSSLPLVGRSHVVGPWLWVAGASDGCHIQAWPASHLCTTLRTSFFLSLSWVQRAPVTDPIKGRVLTP